MPWSFAIVNGRLAEIFFDRSKNGKPKINGHCYVKKEDYKTKTEQKWIKQDTAKVRAVWRKGEYKLVSSKK